MDLLTEYLAENGAAIFTEACTTCVEGIGELHERVALVHGDTCCNNAIGQLNTLEDTREFTYEKSLIKISNVHYGTARLSDKRA